MRKRPSVDEILMASADLWAERSTCSRLQVGCVIADVTGRVVASGYNGAPAGQAHCVHDDDEPCRATIHAESNALLWAARRGTPVGGCFLYVTHAPCWDCAKQIVAAGIVTVAYRERYRTDGGLFYLREAGIPVNQSI